MMTQYATMFDLAPAAALVAGTLCVAWTIADVIARAQTTKTIVKVRR